MEERKRGLTLQNWTMMMTKKRRQFFSKENGGIREGPLIFSEQGSA